MHGSLRVISVLLAGAMALAACTGDEADTDPQPTTTAPATTEPSTTAPSDEDQVRQLVEDWYQVRVDASLDGDFDQAVVERYLSGETLDRFAEAFDDRAARGVVVESPPQDPSTHVVLSAVVAGDAAEVTECEVDGRHEVEEDSGVTVSDSVVTSERRVDLARTEMGWRITLITTTEQREEARTCA